MIHTKLIGFTAATLLLAGTAMAQTSTTPPSAAPSTTAPSMTSPSGSSTSTTTTTTRSTNGAMNAFGQMKASDLIGKNVYAANGDRIGEIDDVVLNQTNKATAAVIGVGGFLGIGERKAAVPMDQLSMQGDRIVASSLTKESLQQMGEYKDNTGGWSRYDRNRPLGDAARQ